MDWMILPYIDFSGIGTQDGAPTFRATTECPNPWPGLIGAAIIGALIVYALKK